MPCPARRATPVAGTQVQPQRDGGVPWSQGNGHVRCRIVCPQAYARRATAASCRWVRRPMRRAWDGGILSL
jgi:hypothetical protein